jgi:methionyl-tRNA synthetase
LAKAQDDARLDQALQFLYRSLYRVTVLASPFLPAKAAAIWAALGQSGPIDQAAWKALENPPREGVSVRRPEILFPKPATPK